MPTPQISARQALAYAISNDRVGVVSQKDAETLVKSAVAEIATSSRPEETFEANKRLFTAASVLIGKDKDTPDVLAGYQQKGMSAVNARLAQLSGGATVLPIEVSRQFETFADDYEVVAAPVNISDIKGSKAEGFEFTYEGADGKSGTAYALETASGDWFFSDQKLTKTDLDKMQAGFESFWDSYIHDELVNDWGLPESEVNDMRASLSPRYAFFADMSSDPYNYKNDYDVCVAFNNPTDSDHGYYLGYDKASGDTDAYTFN